MRAGPRAHHCYFNAPLYTHSPPNAQASPFADALVFRKVKARLGGRVRLVLSGAAPLGDAVQEFLAVTMCAPVLQVRGPRAAAGTGAPPRADGLRAMM